ncbi:hypothetical protein B0H14DRAFT_3422049 [Mycena olivaceomarginata]|nr:hypothetical protein B0H14DRAFT_3422049 [Mycena olivaceomarginata]
MKRRRGARTAEPQPSTRTIPRVPQATNDEPQARTHRRPVPIGGTVANLSDDHHPEPGEARSAHSGDRDCTMSSEPHVTSDEPKARSSYADDHDCSGDRSEDTHSTHPPHLRPLPRTAHPSARVLPTLMFPGSDS